ncbi:MAG: RHS repeat-associated core domain-containing protein, partial [Acholeplasmatales bacterium]|nr:RHS repeat-associated core domain-containing protein [Acholeplasmatales bacterium]
MIYRGYYYDDVSYMYYLKSRFYNPEIRRFMTPDNINYLDITNVGCVNLYAYCNNNPVMYSDPDGRFGLLFSWLVSKVVRNVTAGVATQIAVSTTAYLTAVFMSCFNPTILSDMASIGFNPFNANEESVYSSKLVSFYKGVPVIRKNTGRSGTLWGIALQKDLKDKQTLKHEYGHIIQQCLIGPMNYLLGIGIPSAMSGKVDVPTYYELPWEKTADLFGGVKDSDYHIISKSNYIGSILYLLFLAIL